MRLSYIVVLLLVTVVAPTLLGQSAMPRMTAVDPTAGKAGDVLNVSGENLDKANVSELFLTDGKNDVKVPVTEQTATAIKFKIPTGAKPGRFSLMILTSGKEPKLIEQPVKVTVE
jgi:hypothetical protein